MQGYHQHVDVSLYERLLFSQSLFRKGVRKYSSHPTMLDVTLNVKNTLHIISGSGYCESYTSSQQEDIIEGLRCTNDLSA